MRIAIGADHAGFRAEAAPDRHARRGSDTTSTIAARTAKSRSTIRPSAPTVARLVAGGARRSRHRGRRQRPGRADRRQQGPRRPRRALQRSLYRPPVARSTTTPTSSRSAAASSASASPTRSSRCGSARRSRADATSGASIRLPRSSDAPRSCAEASRPRRVRALTVDTHAQHEAPSRWRSLAATDPEIAAAHRPTSGTARTPASS